MKKRNIALVLALVPFIAACSARLEMVKDNPPTGGDAFKNALYSGYVKLAEMEYAEYDREDGYEFTRRAAASGKGETILPEEISARELPANRVSVLTSARARLMKAFDAGAMQSHPVEAAAAQVAFDCWMQEQEENKQPEHWQACQADFIAAMEAIEPKRVIQAAAPAPKAEPAPAPAPAPAPEPAALPKGMAVYFGFDSADLTSASMDVLKDVRSVMNGFGAKTVTLHAHADRAGDVTYNRALAERRAIAVKLGLIDLGIDPGAIYTNVLGENDPMVPTQDGVREAKNRVVEFVFSR